jgi:transcription elongation factor GreA
MNLANIPRDKAALGSTLVVFDSTKEEEIVYKLVTSEESDVTKGMVSTTSPIGRALMGKKVGDVTTVVTPGGTRELAVLKLTTMHEAAEAEKANGQA